MIAFAKRRWILLSCLVALVVCSVIDATRCVFTENASHEFGIVGGELAYQKSDRAGEYYRAGRLSLHSPSFGSFPSWEVYADSLYLSVPLWLPLSIVVAWITFRELRWREQRAKSAEVYGRN